MSVWKKMWNDHRFVWAFVVVMGLWTIPCTVCGIWEVFFR